jgi:hypothetical protein
MELSLFKGLSKIGFKEKIDYCNGFIEEFKTHKNLTRRVDFYGYNIVFIWMTLDYKYKYYK